MQRLKRSQPAQTKHRGPGGLADAGPRIQKVHGAMHALPFIRGAKEWSKRHSNSSPRGCQDADFVVPFLGQSESLLNYLDELDSKLWQMGLGLRKVLPWWDTEQKHWSLKSLKLRGSRDSLEALSKGSLPLSLWCQQGGSSFPVLFLCRGESAEATAQRQLSHSKASRSPSCQDSG